MFRLFKDCGRPSQDARFLGVTISRGEHTYPFGFHRSSRPGVALITIAQRKAPACRELADESANDHSHRPEAFASGARKAGARCIAC